MFRGKREEKEPEETKEAKNVFQDGAEVNYIYYF